MAVSGRRRSARNSTSRKRTSTRRLRSGKPPVSRWTRLRSSVILHAALMALHAASGQQDSTYATPALRALVERAAKANAEVPATLGSYRASVETEMALMVVDTAGTECTGQIEQLSGIAS